MQGDLRTTSLEQLCRTLDDRAATGELTISQEPRRVQIWFRQGRVVRAASSSHQMRLGDRLVHGGLITADHLREALDHQRASNQPLGEVLVEQGLVNQHVVRVFTQEQVLDSLFAAVRWTSGSYSFVEAEVAQDSVPSDLTVSQLLFALESRHRRWDEITRTIPDLSAVPEFVPGADPMEARLEPGEASVVRAIGSGRSLEAIADDLGFGPFEVAMVVHGLAVLGLVRVVNTGPASGGSALAEAAALLMDEAPAPRQSTTPPSPAAPVHQSDEDDDLALQLADLSDLDLAPSAPVAPAPPAPAPEPAPAVRASVDDELSFEIADSPDPGPMVAPTYAHNDDDDIAPWAFTIEGETTGQDVARPRPATPITSTAAVGDASTGTPLPVVEPAAAEPSVPEPFAIEVEPSAPDEPSSSRPRTGEMSDLLRELRQLSGE